MSDTDAVLKCPRCGEPIHIREALAQQLRGEIEAEARTREAERLRQAVAEAEGRAREALAAELQLLQGRLGEQERKLREAQAAELALRREKAALEERQRELDLEVARRLDAEKRALEEAVRKAVAEEQALKLKEKDRLIEDLKKHLEEAKRRSEQGSQELQGEVLELDLEAELGRRFPQDVVKPVPKGMRGADLVQLVRDGALRPCGTIVWEAKNTRHWQPAWLDKLKEDQRAIGANLAVLVSVALPPDLGEFGLVDGVWVASLRVWPALAIALRDQLVRVADAHRALEGRQEKTELLYRYLVGDQFRGRVQAIVEAFSELQQQLGQERRAMERLWREREKRIEQVLLHTAGMYGEMRGIVGGSLPEIPALGLEAKPALGDQSGK